MVIILGMMQVSKKIPFDNPDVLLGVRGLYIVSNLVILGIYLYVQSVINKKKGMDIRSPIAHLVLVHRRIVVNFCGVRYDHSQVRGALGDGV
jgi:hypothetical protein